MERVQELELLELLELEAEEYNVDLTELRSEDINYDREPSEDLEGQGSQELKTEWLPDNDAIADWYIEISQEEIKQIERLEQALEDKIARYKYKLDKVKAKKDRRIETLNHKLELYLELKVDPKDVKTTKTQAKYSLPSGTIIKKYPKPKVVRDNDQLLEWTKGNDLYNYIQVKESVAWADLKKETIEVGGKVVYKETGEVIEGITLEERTPTVEVKID